MIKIVNESKEPFKYDTNTSYYNDLMDDSPLNGNSRYSTKDYYRFEKGIEAHIEYMTASAYLDACTTNIFSGRNAYKGLNKDNINKYAQLMKDGIKFPLPYLNYADTAQEGRHRMLAAAQAFGEHEEFPVLVVVDASPTDEEIWDYAEKKYPKDPQWVFDYVSAKFRNNNDDEVDIEDIEEIEDEYESEIVTCMDVSTGDIVDFGDGPFLIQDVDLSDRDFIEFNGKLIDTDEDRMYYRDNEESVELLHIVGD